MARARTESKNGTADKPRTPSRAHVPDSSNPLDSRLIQNCVNGDSDAWRQFVARYERLIFSVALRICRDREVAADVMQQVFLQIYQQLDELTTVTNLSAWIVTIARRRSCDYLRSLRPLDPLPEEGFEDSTDDFSRLQQRHAIEMAMAQLPARTQQLIELLYMSPDNPSYEEVARRLGMPVSSIGPTRLRALKKLKKLLS